MAQEDLINLRRMISSKNPRLIKWIPGFILRYIERIIHQDEINTFLRDRPDSYNQKFCADVVEYLNITYEIRGLEKIPKTGKCVLAMNHPLGGMDAIILVDALRNHRTDIKFIVNDLLLNLGRLNEIFVGINKHGKNKGDSIKQVSDLFASDNLVCIFPAGLVSRRTKGIVQDLEWKKTFVKQAKTNNQPILPIHIKGKLSNFFYRLANFRKFLGIKANIEMLYLPDELFRQRNQHVVFTVGDMITTEELKSHKSDKEAASWVQKHVMTLNSDTK